MDPDSGIYALENEGPQDLDSVMVHRPQSDDGITYPIARTGQGWADEADVGPLPLGGQGRFTQSFGAGKLLKMPVRIVCRAGDEIWTISRFLPLPPTERDPVTGLKPPG